MPLVQPPRRICAVRYPKTTPPNLTGPWRRSMEATHHFLSSLAVDELYAAVLRDYLPAVEEIWLAEYGPRTPQNTT